MDIETKLKKIEKILKRKRFVRVEVDTICYSEGARYRTSRMAYIGSESFGPFPQQITLYKELEYRRKSKKPQFVGVPDEIYLHNIEKITLLKSE